MASIDDIISNALAIANDKVDDADEAADAAVLASQGFASLAPIDVNFSVTAVEPAVPAVINGTQTYEAQLEKLIALLSQQFANFFTIYYPLGSDAFDEATNWQLNTITNGGTGINTAIEAQLFARGRERIISEGQRVENQVAADFASRGFQLPPGAMAGQLLELRKAQLGQTGDYARDVAFKQFDEELKNVRFAIEMAINSRQFAMQAAADYIRALMSAPDAAARVALVNSDVQAKMISATSDLYRARLSRDELILKSKEITVDSTLKAGMVNVDGYYKGIDARVKAAGHAAGVYGSAAGAALSSLNSLVSSSEITNL
jgi:hypothetical protein